MFGTGLVAGARLGGLALLVGRNERDRLVRGGRFFLLLGENLAPGVGSFAEMPVRQISRRQHGQVG